MSPEQQAFLDAIREDPADAATRYAYADWLDEHGFDDEAAFARRWTPERHAEAGAWLERFINVYADKYDSEDDGPLPRPTVGQLLDAARAYLKDGSKTCFHSGQGFGFCDAMATDYERQLFWKHYSTYDGVPVDADVMETGELFSCCRSY